MLKFTDLLVNPQKAEFPLQPFVPRKISHIVFETENKNAVFVKKKKICSVVRKEIDDFLYVPFDFVNWEEDILYEEKSIENVYKEKYKSLLDENEEDSFKEGVKEGIYLNKEFVENQLDTKKDSLKDSVKDSIKDSLKDLGKGEIYSNRNLVENQLDTKKDSLKDSVKDSIKDSLKDLGKGEIYSNRNLVENQLDTKKDSLKDSVKDSIKDSFKDSVNEKGCAHIPNSFNVLDYFRNSKPFINPIPLSTQLLVENLFTTKWEHQIDNLSNRFELLYNDPNLIFFAAEKKKPKTRRYNLSNDKYYNLKKHHKAESLSVYGVQHSLVATEFNDLFYDTCIVKELFKLWHRNYFDLVKYLQKGFYKHEVYLSQDKNKFKEAFSPNYDQNISNTSAQLLYTGNNIKSDRKNALFSGGLSSNSNSSTHLFNKTPSYAREYAHSITFSPLNPSPLTFNTVSDLSLSAKTPLFLLEYLEEYPVPLSKAGMASLIEQGTENLTISNNLYKSQLYDHKMDLFVVTIQNSALKNKYETDSIFYKNTASYKSVHFFYIQKTTKLYSVSQLNPIEEIYSPHSKQCNLYCKTRIQQSFLKLNKNLTTTVKMKDLDIKFNTFSEGLKRKWLKEFAVKNKDNSYSINLRGYLQQEELLPESVCLYEAMLLSEYLIKDEIITNENSFWNLSRNYLKNQIVVESKKDKEIKGVRLFKKPVGVNYSKGILDKDILNKKLGELNELMKQEVKVENLPKSMILGLRNSKQDSKNVRKWDSNKKADHNQFSGINKGVDFNKVENRHSGSNHSKKELLDFNKGLDFRDSVNSHYSDNKGLDFNNGDFRGNVNSHYSGNMGLDFNNRDGGNGHQEINKQVDLIGCVNNHFTINKGINNPSNVQNIQNGSFCNKKDGNNSTPTNFTKDSANLPSAIKIVRYIGNNKEEETITNVKIITQYIKERQKLKKEDSRKILIKCSKCKQIGHMKTNKQCKYYEGEKMDKKLKEKEFKKKRNLLSENILKVINECFKMRLSSVFHKPVNVKRFVDYLDKIKEPMDLSSIKNKARLHVYEKFDAFIRDLKLMYENCCIYNGREHTFSKVAGDMVILGEKWREGNKDIIEIGERAIQEFKGRNE